MGNGTRTYYSSEVVTYLLFKYLCEHSQSPLTEDIIKEALTNASCNKNGLDICKYLFIIDNKHIETALGTAYQYGNHAIIKYICKKLLETNNPFANTLSMMLVSTILADDVEFLEDVYHPYLLGSNVSIDFSVLSCCWTYECLKFTLDQDGMNIDGLKRVCLNVDPSIVYIIDNYMR